MQLNFYVFVAKCFNYIFILRIYDIITLSSGWY